MQAAKKYSKNQRRNFGAWMNKPNDTPKFHLPPGAVQ